MVVVDIQIHQQSPLVDLEQELLLLVKLIAESAFYGVGAALGFSLVLIVFAGIRERLQLSDIPQPFQGASIALITAGFMALALMGFTGMIRL